MGPTGPEGWVLELGRPVPLTTHSSPWAGASGARFAVSGTSSGMWLGTRYTPPLPTLVPYPTPYTRPRTPAVDSTADVDGTTGTCTYDRF